MSGATLPVTIPLRQHSRASSLRWFLRKNPRMLAGVVLLAIAAWQALRPHAPAPRDPNAIANWSDPRLLDSLRAAEGRRDGGAGVRFASEMVRREPRNSTYLLRLATELNNYAWTGTSYGRARTAMRTSLDRRAVFDYCFTLLDSAAVLTRDPRELVTIRRVRGQLYELVGLPLDALAIYQDIEHGAPGDPLTRGRMAWVNDHLHDPLTPDAEWLRRRDAEIAAAAAKRAAADKRAAAKR